MQYYVITDCPKWLTLVEMILATNRDFQLAKLQHPRLGVSLVEVLAGRYQTSPLPDCSDTLQDASDTPQIKHNIALGKAPTHLIRDNILRYFIPQDNPGNGDCLLYALEGNNLSEEQISQARCQLADVRLHLAEDKLANAIWLANMLKKTPLTKEVVGRLMAGRVDIDNHTFAQAQRKNGFYSGEPEMMQWSLLRSQKIIYLTCDLQLYLFDGNQDQKYKIDPDNFWQTYTNDTLMLRFQDNHWQRLELNCTTVK